MICEMLVEHNQIAAERVVIWKIGRSFCGDEGGQWRCCTRTTSATAGLPARLAGAFECGRHEPF
jgi:hypothetical protein